MHIENIHCIKLSGDKRLAYPSGQYPNRSRRYIILDKDNKIVNSFIFFGFLPVKYDNPINISKNDQKRININLLK